MTLLTEAMVLSGRAVRPGIMARRPGRRASTPGAERGPGVKAAVRPERGTTVAGPATKVPGHRDNRRFRPNATADVTPSPEPLEILHEVFGYPAFRGEQQAIVEHVAGGGDALVLMPTGAGKSLCYQLPAIARHRADRGVTVVVSPLIALMHDQVSALEELGVHARSEERRVGKE